MLEVVTPDRLSIASGIFAYIPGGTATYFTAASLEDYMHLCPNELLVWEAMSLLHNEGVNDLILGGVAHYKKKYAPMLEKASAKERNQLLLKYYKDILEFRRAAVQEVLRIRLEDQLPIAEDIEAKMAKIRAEHKDMISAFLNYPQMTASLYFAQVSALLDVPTYAD